MIRLRPYKKSDAQYLIQWFSNEYEFQKWSAQKFEYPLTTEQLDRFYNSCEEDEHVWSMTALDENGIVTGHIFMRKANYERNSIHFGFIIIDPKQRGKGYGKEMLSTALSYAFDILGVKKVTLGVFDNNPAAHKCYQSCGFRDVEYNEKYISFQGEDWGIYDMAIEK